jgi:iron complex outermembrane receptor protein
MHCTGPADGSSAHLPSIGHTMAFQNQARLHSLKPRRRAVILACQGLIATLAAAQSAEPQADAELPRVTVTAPAPATAGIAGWGDRPLDSLPLQATVIGREQIDATGARRLADLLKLDASATDAYNSPGYWDFIAVRGYTLDPRFNVRREGLPISAETAIPLENKDRVEILKGTSGIQAGTSAPGGLVNFVVKRPTSRPLASTTLTAGERGSLGVALDWSGGKSEDTPFAQRISAAYEDRQPAIDQYGHLRRGVLAWAGDWQLARDTLVQAEVESSRQIGASLPAYSLTGNAVPAPRRPRNLGDLPWALPNTFGALTGSLMLDQRLAGLWRWITQVGTQRLKTDDRLPFAFGCTDSNGDYYADRYCPSGSFDLYDFRSDDERRRTDAAETALQGRVQTGALTHDMRFGVQASRQRIDVNRQAFNFVGTGNIDGNFSAPADPTLTDEGTNRRERSTEAFAQDAIDWGAGFTTWLGLRQTRLQRESVRTDGTRATRYGQSIATPWLAASYSWQPQYSVYASWGRGAESAVVPGRADRYSNAGEPLPTLKSRQWELGWRGATQSGTALRGTWNLAWFDIDRPAVTDTGTAYFIDGSARHRGIDAAGNLEQGAWTLAASAMWLDAERRRSSDPILNGQRPTNVPERTARLQARWRVPTVQGLELAADLSHEGRRNVLPDGSIELPSWTRTDLGAKRQMPTATLGTLTWRVGIDNLFDRRAWKESPTQFGHVYLYPLEARTLRVSLQAAL